VVVRLPGFLRYPRDLAALLGDVLASIARRPPPRGRVIAQMHAVGNGSFLFIAITVAFLGMILVYQGVIQASKVLPDNSMAGAALINAVIREFGPTITALMVATRVGTGIAAEIGSMVVTDQVEAMKVTNTDPVEYLVAPRFLAFVTMMFVLAIWAVVVAVAAGLLVAVVRFQINANTFLTLRMVGWRQVTEGLLKCLAYGVTIPIIAAESGFRATGGSEGVGWATTRAVVNASVAIILWDFVIATGMYLF
jgi:phospholipid/cholesterol/gamma-HCH transport system permease protein